MASSDPIELEAQARRCGVPDHDIECLIGWILDAGDVGGFLTAVLNNNLKEAALSADNENARCLAQIVAFLWNFAPEGCWGSPANVERWRKKGGLNGVLAKAGGHRA